MCRFSICKACIACHPQCNCRAEGRGAAGVAGASVLIDLYAMSKKRRGGYVLLLLLSLFAIRCSLSTVVFSFQTPRYVPYEFFNSSLWNLTLLSTPHPNPIDTNSSSLTNSSNPSISVTDSSEELLVNNTIVSEYPTIDPKISKTPKVEPVWGYMVKHLERPNITEEASRAMREGAQAWEEITEVMAEEAKKRANSSGTHQKRVGNKCPYFVSALNATQLKTDPFLLPIPCGLVLDSSVTVVATPGVSSGRFSLELIGSMLFGEDDEPVVFHFSVRLRGDQVTEHPIIVHNTWTVGGDWQTEQRCPTVPDSKGDDDTTVDGLKLCNPDIGQKITRKVGPGLWNELNVVGSPSTWFPFAEGFPFVATISVGGDGFHVSINGKHVSSFKYRQSLEPWMVNSLRIKGDLQTSSVIVNGLPISDDASLIPDLKVIRAPTLPKKATLFIGVFSSNSNFVRRMAVRRTWMQYPEVRNGTVVVRFFVGLHQNKQVNEERWSESLTYGDMQILPMVDYYNIITYKTLAICMYAEYNLQTKYVMKTDDDTFVRVDAVLSSIVESRHNYSLLLGNVAFNANPARDPSNKWFINISDWGDATYPPWAHGPGYILSQDLAHFVVRGHQKNILKFFKLEDVAMGIWIDQYKTLKNKTVDYVSLESYQHGQCENGFIISHYQNPTQMQCLWSKELEGQHGICCNTEP